MPNEQIQVDIVLDGKKYTTGLKKATNETKKFADKSEKGFSSVTKSVATMATGFVSFGVVLSQIKKGFVDLQQETVGISKVNAVLKSTGGVAGVTAKQIEDLTLNIQKTTTTSQDAAREVASLGLTFTNINKDVFPEYMKLAADMSTITGQDMAGSALQLGKALQDPILGATALRRVGVNLTKQQQEQIKVFVKSGQTLKAQQIILKELKTEFGGAAEAVGSDFFGTITRAFNAIGDFQRLL